MYFDKLVEARFVQRLNRFAALVDLAGKDIVVHVANSGRMKELLAEGRRVFLKPAQGDHRKTSFDLALVDTERGLVSADARLPNTLTHEAITEGRLTQFTEYNTIQKEVFYGESRLDLALDSPRGRCFVETKSVTLVVGETGLFPDSPTSRGKKHMGSLSKAANEGYRAAVIFIVQRNDPKAFKPNDEADPQFGHALRQAMENGVEAYAYKCQVTYTEITLAERLQMDV